MNNPIPTLSDGQSDALRKNLMALLAAQAGRYTQGASGSLPKETMDELLVSALYTLSVDPTRPESFAPLVGQNIFACFFQAQTRLLQKRDAALAMAYAALCNAKIQFLLSRIEMLTMQSCRGKVLAFLLAEKREDGVILLRGTRDELASRLSVSRAALYRELSALQSGGYLEVGESRLRVLNTSALEKLLYGV